MLDLAALVTHLASRAADENPDPFVLRLLLSQYRATGRDDLFEVLGGAVARGVDACRRDEASADRPQWLHAMCEAVAVSDDAVVADCAHALFAATRQQTTPACVEAALRAAIALRQHSAVAALVDNLERLVAREYEPGETIPDQMAVASALLTAYHVTGRIPYAMLAEELVQTASGREQSDNTVIAASQTAQVLCGLAALHRDQDYCAVAVIAPNADYGSDAGRILARHEGALARPRDAAAFGLALARWLDLQ